MRRRLRWTWLARRRALAAVALLVTSLGTPAAGLAGSSGSEASGPPVPALVSPTADLAGACLLDEADGAEADLAEAPLLPAPADYGLLRDRLAADPSTRSVGPSTPSRGEGTPFVPPVPPPATVPQTYAGTCDAAPAQSFVSTVPPTGRACGDPALDIPVAILQQCADKFLPDWPENTVKAVQAVKDGAQWVAKTVTDISVKCGAIGAAAPACVATYFLVTYGKKALECGLKGLVDGMDIRPDNKEALRGILNAKYDLPSTDIDKFKKADWAGKKEFVEKLYSGTQKEVKDAIPVAAWVRKIARQPRLDYAATSGLRSVREEMGYCRLGSAEALLAGATTAAQAALLEAHREMREVEHERVCLESVFHRQYGVADWKRNVLFQLQMGVPGGSPMDQWNQLVQSAETLKAEEPSRLAVLNDAGALCRQLNEAEKALDRARERYRTLQDDGDKALGKCDLAAARQALAGMKRLEGTKCGRQIIAFAETGPPSGPFETKLTAATRTCTPTPVASGGMCQNSYQCLQCSEKVYAFCTSSALGEMNPARCQDAANLCPKCGAPIPSITEIKKECYAKAVERCKSCRFGSEEYCQNKAKSVCNYKP